MVKVWFRCDGRHTKIFQLNSCKEMNYVPVVGDKIATTKKDFMKASFRIKPWSKDDSRKNIKNETSLDFIVKSRTYCTSRNQWELLCEPESSSLVFLLGRIKV